MPWRRVSWSDRESPRAAARGLCLAPVRATARMTAGGKQMAERNDGKSLEELVKLVEGMHLPPGFTVEHGKRIYNDDGKQIAELDILISGIVGTVNYSTLFECRNRPSDGPADGGW